MDDMNYLRKSSQCEHPEPITHYIRKLPLMKYVTPFENKYICPKMVVVICANNESGCLKQMTFSSSQVR